MATSSAIWQQAAPITYHLLAVQQETYKKKAHVFMENIGEFSGGENSGPYGP